VPTLERQGLHLDYEVYGRGRPGTPLLLTHGYGESRSMWDSNTDVLSRDRMVITWSLRGHGASDAPDDPTPYTREDSLLDMAALLDRVGAPRAVLGGMSLGGYLSLLFNARLPERVAALVLVDTGPGFRNPEARERWNEWVGSQAGDAPTVGLAHAARGIMVQADATVFESLETIAVPTLIVVGSEDAQFLPAAEVMEKRIPGARKVVLVGAGHRANVDAAQEFNAAVSQFLEEL
jgi:pimeloyl-ACP methyl ester carboxylesterase